MIANDFSAWDMLTPVLTLDADGEFRVFDLGSPVVEISESDIKDDRRKVEVA